MQKILISKIPNAIGANRIFVPQQKLLVDLVCNTELIEDDGKYICDPNKPFGNYSFEKEIINGKIIYQNYAECSYSE